MTTSAPERPRTPHRAWVIVTVGGSGVGEALLRRAFYDLHARGLRRVGLGVDAESPTGATRLYERAGMTVYRDTVFLDRPARGS